MYTYSIYIYIYVCMYIYQPTCNHLHFTRSTSMASCETPCLCAWRTSGRLCFLSRRIGQAIAIWFLYLFDIGQSKHLMFRGRNSSPVSQWFELHTSLGETKNKGRKFNVGCFILFSQCKEIIRLVSTYRFHILGIHGDCLKRYKRLFRCS